MKNIYNLYLSNDDKDILFELERMENEDATIPNSAELCLPDVSATFSRQTCTVANKLSADSTTAIKSRVALGIG